MNWFTRGHGNGSRLRDYRGADLRSYAKWLEYSGCPHAEDAVKTAAAKRLDLDRIVGAWETRLHARESFVNAHDLHDLDEFDCIVEELTMWHARHES